MSDRYDYGFFAWCDESERIGAFIAAASALASPGRLCSINIELHGVRKELWRSEIYLNELIAMVHANVTSRSNVEVGLPVELCSGFAAGLSLKSYGPGYWSERWRPAPLELRAGSTYLYATELEIALLGGKRAVTVEAAIASMQLQAETMDLTRRLCAPDETKRVTVGGCCKASQWQAPLESAATYHADGKVARDLALSWVHLHDGDRIAYAAGLSLDTLTARVEAAPKGAQVGVAPNVERAYEHYDLDQDALHIPTYRPASANAVRNGLRAPLPGDIPLTREQVRAALATPNETLLEALEAAAVPDDEWRAVEPQAIEMIEAKKKGAPTYIVDVTTGRHVRFIEQHAPYHVRRLPNGGVMLATHPYRTLWPLWQDALALLDITP